LIVFLCSDEASYITGTTVTPDGGFTLTIWRRGVPVTHAVGTAGRDGLRPAARPGLLRLGSLA
jgi:hypothetical protein